MTNHQVVVCEVRFLIVPLVCLSLDAFCSGCGTGRSTLLLGTMYPDHIVIGVDRSLARLSKNGVYRQQSTKDEEGNVFMVRAELADFWRLFLDNPLGTVDKHYMLNPNPYPKKRRFQNRWYAHPTFPMIRQLGGEEIVIRSNWKAYLEDFSMAISIAEKLGDEETTIASYEPDGPVELDPTKHAWTNFEQKYFDVGETAYELILKRT
jgi:tRNA (guanine-N7-)-methyltransferase